MHCPKSSKLSSQDILLSYAKDNNLILRENLFDVNVQVALPFMTQVDTSTAYVLRLSKYDSSTPNVVSFTISYLDISVSPAKEQPLFTTPWFNYQSDQPIKSLAGFFNFLVSKQPQ